MYFHLVQNFWSLSSKHFILFKNEKLFDEMSAATVTVTETEKPYVVTSTYLLLY